MATLMYGAPNSPLDSAELSLEKLSWKMLGLGIVVMLGSRALVFRAFQLPNFGSFFETVGLSPNNASSVAALAILYWLSKPSLGHFRAVMILGAFLEVGYLAQLPAAWGWFDRVLTAGGGLGVGALLGLVHLALLGPPPNGRRRARAYLGIGLVLLLYPFISGAMIGCLSYLTPLVYDAYGYNVEGSLGFFPSFEIARWQAMHPYAERFLHVVYARLLIWLLLAFALNSMHRERSYSDFFPAFALSGLVALCYSYALPMVGIDLYLGQPPWPFGPIPETAALKPVLAPADYPRTCIPSMHSCWILIAYFAVSRLTPRIRGFYLFLAVTTMLAAVGPRVGHYLIDLVAAFPFAASWQALTTNSSKATDAWKRWGFFLGQAATLGYCLAIRWYAPFWTSHPWLFWGLSLTLIGASLWLEKQLADRALKVQPPEATS